MPPEVCTIIARMYLFLCCVLLLLAERAKDLAEILQIFDKGKLHSRNFESPNYEQEYYNAKQQSDQSQDRNS